MCLCLIAVTGVEELRAVWSLTPVIIIICQFVSCVAVFGLCSISRRRVCPFACRLSTSDWLRWRLWRRGVLWRRRVRRRAGGSGVVAAGSWFGGEGGDVLSACASSGGRGCPLRGPPVPPSAAGTRLVTPTHRSSSFYPSQFIDTPSPPLQSKSILKNART